MTAITVAATDFVAVLCAKERGGCGGVVEDYIEGKPPSRLHRPICPKCNRRVWVQNGQAIRVDRKPSKLPRAAA